MFGVAAVVATVSIFLVSQVTNALAVVVLLSSTLFFLALVRPVLGHPVHPRDPGLCGSEHGAAREGRLEVEGSSAPLRC